MSSLQIRGSWGYFVLICEWNPHPGPWVSKTQDDTGMVRRGGAPSTGTYLGTGAGSRYLYMLDAFS